MFGAIVGAPEARHAKNVHDQGVIRFWTFAKGAVLFILCIVALVVA
jgi:hypothetical protein